MSKENNKKRLVIIPTYNEIDSIPQLIDRIWETRNELDILIVDDSSPDRTGQWAKEQSEKDKRLHVLIRAEKTGLGSAYIAGFKYALKENYDEIIQMDADGSHDPKYIPELIRELNNFDIVTGSRWIEGGGVENWPVQRKVISVVGNEYSRRVLNVKVHDITSGFKAIRKRVIEKIPLDHIKARGFGFQIEFVYRAIKEGFRVGEIPIIFNNRDKGRSKFSSDIFMEAFLTVPILRWWSISGKL